MHSCHQEDTRDPISVNGCSHGDVGSMSCCWKCNMGWGRYRRCAVCLQHLHPKEAIDPQYPEPCSWELGCGCLCWVVIAWLPHLYTQSGAHIVAGV